MLTLGERIRAIRKDVRLTQAEFATELRISRPHLNKLENNKENPSGTLIRLISTLFQIDEDWIKNGN